MTQMVTMSTRRVKTLLRKRRLYLDPCKGYLVADSFCQHDKDTVLFPAIIHIERFTHADGTPMFTKTEEEYESD